MVTRSVSLIALHWAQLQLSWVTACNCGNSNWGSSTPNFCVGGKSSMKESSKKAKKKADFSNNK